jgi:M6 family metalloprotease-like protein
VKAENDFVYQSVQGSVNVYSLRAAKITWTFLLRDVGIQGWERFSWFVSSLVTINTVKMIKLRAYDETGDLSYDYPYWPNDAESLYIRIYFRRALNPGDTYKLSFDQELEWPWDIIRWRISASTTRTFEHIDFRIDVAQPLRITFTSPAGVFSEDRKSAEASADKVKSLGLTAAYPPTIGEQRILAILVRFPDASPTHTKEEINNLIFHEMDSYYRENSYGLTWISVNTTDWIVNSKTITSYNLNQWDSKDEDIERFIADTIRLADPQVDFAKYRYVFMVAAGDRVWPFSYAARAPTDDGVAVERVTVQTESSTLRTFAHEFGHALGLPDLYDYEIAAQPGVNLEAAIHVGPWCLMSRGANIADMMAWSRITLGWVKQAQVRTVHVGDIVNTKISPLEMNTNETLVVKIAVTETRYYLVEDRQRTGFDTTIPDTGVLLSYIDERIEGGKGPVRVADANTNTTTLADATFDLRSGKSDTFANEKAGIGILLIERLNDNYLVHLATPTLINDSKQLIKQSSTALLKAEEEIERARKEGRTEGLGDAAETLREAQASFGQGNYRQALQLAESAQQLARNARIVASAQSTTSAPGFLLPGIPGFPIEAIFAGLVCGLVALALIHRRRSGRWK